MHLEVALFSSGSLEMALAFVWGKGHIEANKEGVLDVYEKS